MIEDAGPGVKSKTSTKFIERTAKLPDRWDLAKELSQKMADVQEVTQGSVWLRSSYSTLKLHL
jgi:hypothetical protein